VYGIIKIMKEMGKEKIPEWNFLGMFFELPLAKNDPE
jgi:hypothetical protein